MEIKRRIEPTMFEHMVKVSKTTHDKSYYQIYEWLDTTYGPEKETWSFHKIFSSKSGTECIATFKSEKQLTMFLLRWQQNNIVTEIPNGALTDHWRLVIKNQYW